MAIYRKRNFAGGNQYPPINCENDEFMVDQNLRVALLSPIKVHQRKTFGELQRLKYLKKMSTFKNKKIC